MIDQVDIDFIDENHFEIIGKKPYTLVIRSRSTGHYWSLLEQVYNGHRTFQICHKHKEAEPYHPQKTGHLSLVAASTSGAMINTR